MGGSDKARWRGDQILFHMFYDFWGRVGKEQEGQHWQTCVLGPSSRVAAITDASSLANRYGCR